MNGWAFWLETLPLYVSMALEHECGLVLDEWVLMHLDKPYKLGGIGSDIINYLFILDCIDWLVGYTSYL